ncbi:MAG: hypothetical protein JOZ67_12480 [Gammaproteobacteria bacterium]|nr:hypothetical protein [Gammaproteobacteria bacterium]
MRTSLKVLVAATVAAAGAGTASAYGPTTTPDLSFYVSGGSAQNRAFLAFAESLMAADGNLDVYSDTTSSACALGSNYEAVFGTWKTTQGGITAGKKVIIYYANNGGTFKNGIDTLARAKTNDFGTFLGSGVSVTGGSCAAAGTGVPAPFTATANYHLAAANVANNQVPDVGLSDEEMGLFTGPNLPSGSNPLTAADFNNTNRASLYENVFGVAIDTQLASDMTTKWSNNNITNAQVAAILAGNYTDWGQVCQVNPPAAEVCLTAGAITFITRSPGSGSKAAWNEFFLNNPGTSGYAGNSVAPNDGPTGNCSTFPATSYNVCPQGSNGAVKTALNTAFASGTRAIGILGMEFQPGSSDHYSFAALNGYVIDGVTTKTCGNAQADAFEPARVVNGDHALFFTNSLQVRNKIINGNSRFDGSSTGNSGDFINAFRTAAANPVLDVSVPGVLLDPGVSGPPSGNPYDACITKGTHNGDSTLPLQLGF